MKAGVDAVMRGKPVCVPGTFNKVSAALMRPLPLWLQYQLGKAFNPFK